MSRRKYKDRGRHRRKRVLEMLREKEDKEEIGRQDFFETEAKTGADYGNPGESANVI